MLFPGNSTAEKILNATQLQIKESGVTPGLGVILVGDDVASHLYVGIKERRAKALGIYFEKQIFPATVSQETVEAAIQSMNADEKLHGIIVQLPLPAQLDTEALIAAIDPKKDTDGFHPVTLEKFLNGEKERLPVFPRAMIEMVREANGKTSQREKTNALAVVNSSLMGEVLKAALTQEGFAAQYIFGTEREKLAELLPEQSVVLTAVGKPAILSTEKALAGAVIVDGGIYYDEDGRVIGDVARDDGVYRTDIKVTPVPGGVGPVTVAVLLARVTEAALSKEGNNKL